MEVITDSLEIRPASDRDRTAIRSLVEGSGLPTEDLDSGMPEFLVALKGGRLIATGALQRFGPVALLRSVAVVPEERGKGCGRAIVAALERAAQQTDVHELVLLTLTAVDFFGRAGYSTTDRRAVAEPIADSAEFRTLCPASAVCMSKVLPAAQARRHG